MSRSVMSLARCIWIALSFIGGSISAAAQVVALGASNSLVYPTYLEAMLRARGYNVTVANVSSSGLTTAGMLGRLSAVPPGTRVVLLQPGGNDERRGLVSSVPQILALLREKGIKVIIVGRTYQALPKEMRQGNHLSDEGYHLLAAGLLPQVIAALGSSRP